MNSKAALLLAGALIGGGGVALSRAPVVAVTTPAEAALGDNSRVLTRFGNVFDTVRGAYVEEPDAAVMIEGAIKGMLGSLDPHSGYLNAAAFKAFRADIAGRFGGVGIEVTMEDGVVKVVSPIDATPASRAGLLANDLIVRIDGEDVHG